MGWIIDKWKRQINERDGLIGRANKRKIEEKAKKEQEEALRKLQMELVIKKIEEAKRLEMEMEKQKLPKSEPEKQSAPPKSETMSQSTIIGLAVGIPLFVLLLIVTIFLFIRRKS